MGTGRKGEKRSKTQKGKRDNHKLVCDQQATLLPRRRRLLASWCLRFLVLVLACCWCGQECHEMRCAPLRQSLNESRIWNRCVLAAAAGQVVRKSEVVLFPGLLTVPCPILLPCPLRQSFPK